MIGKIVRARFIGHPLFSLLIIVTWLIPISLDHSVSDLDFPCKHRILDRRVLSPFPP